MTRAPEPEQPNHSTGSRREEQVEQEGSLQLGAGQLPLPGDDASGQREYGGEGGAQQIVLCGYGQGGFFPPHREQIEKKAGQQEGDWEMDYDHVLRMVSQKNGFQVKKCHKERSCGCSMICVGVV